MTLPARLAGVALFYNDIACEDESATDAEAMEKILFYHPTSDPPRAQLNHLR